MKIGEQTNNRSKDLLALGCIIAAAVGLVMGIMFPAAVGGVFSVGTIISFVGFIVSLGAVKDRGSNLPALTAFFATFITMSITIFRTGMSM